MSVPPRGTRPCTHIEVLLPCAHTGYAVLTAVRVVEWMRFRIQSEGEKMLMQVVSVVYTILPDSGPFLMFLGIFRPHVFQIVTRVG